MLQDQIIAEINQIPDEKLLEIYDLIHYFRLGLTQETREIKSGLPERQPGSLKRFGLLQGKNYNIPDNFNDPLDDLKEYME